MTRKGAEGAVMVSAVVVSAVYAYRKLIEPHASTPEHESKAHPVSKVIGAEPAPASLGAFAVGFGFTFFSLAVIATFAPNLAGSFAVTVAVGDVLVNGASVFVDVSDQVGHTARTGKV